MLRLPRIDVVTPRTLEEALGFLADPGFKSMPVAGGTDVLPNLKHRLHDVDRVVSLARLDELRGVEERPDGSLSIGAMTSLHEVAHSRVVRTRAPAVAIAAGLVSGPQLRRMGTLGGNVLLDTRCRYYNQTFFWRKSLGFCLKKDGSVCHVVAGGSRCVAAASNDTAPALLTVGAKLELASAQGARSAPLDGFYAHDGAAHRAMDGAELLTHVVIPPQRAGHRGGYVKLRARDAIDFPLLGVAARVDVEHDVITGADVAVVALQARPVRLKQVSELLEGKPVSGALLDAALAQVAERASKQCRPMPNVVGDAEYRHLMVPVYVKRALLGALGSA